MQLFSLLMACCACAGDDYMKTSLSVIFITKNEEFHIGAAIDNAMEIAETVFVVDSGSTDKTVAIAESHGATVLFHRFEGFGKQWNWALENCPVKSEWTMKMDPDERLGGELITEIRNAILNGDFDGYSFKRVLYFMGRRLDSMTSEVVRIWKTGKCKFTDVAVNEHPIVNGRVVHLDGLMEHYDSRDLHQWIEKQNHYSSLEAIRWFKGDANAAKPKLFGTSLERRMWLKVAFFKLPFRYIVLRLYYYIIKGLWKSGYEGRAFVRYRIWNWRLREDKVREMRTVGRLVALT